MKFLSSSMFGVIFECMKSDMIHSFDCEDWHHFEQIVESSGRMKLVIDGESYLAIESSGLVNCLGGRNFRLMPRVECIDLFGVGDIDYIELEHEYFFIKGAWIGSDESIEFSDEQMNKVRRLFHLIVDAEAL